MLTTNHIQSAPLKMIKNLNIFLGSSDLKDLVSAPQDAMEECVETSDTITNEEIRDVPNSVRHKLIAVKFFHFIDPRPDLYAIAKGAFMVMSYENIIECVCTNSESLFFYIVLKTNKAIYIKQLHYDLDLYLDDVAIFVKSKKGNSLLFSKLEYMNLHCKNVRSSGSTRVTILFCYDYLCTL